MFFPEFLLRLSARDQQVTWLDPLITDNTESVAATTATGSVTVPDGRVLILQSAFSAAVPGAAQNVGTFHSIELGDPAATQIIELTQIRNALAAGINSTLSWSGSVVVPPAWRVRGRANFNAGVAANAVSINVVGILIPVGNISRV